MMSGPNKLLVMALLIVPGMAWADFLAERIGQGSGATSLLLQPQVAFLSREPALLVFPYGTTRLGLSMSYSDDSFDNPADLPLVPLVQQRRVSAMAVGELTINERIALFGKFGLRYPAGGVPLPVTMAHGAGTLLPLDQRYGVGVNLRASEVLSLHFEWERYAPAGVGVGSDPNHFDWDPWKEKNVFGAGMRLGF